MPRIYKPQFTNEELKVIKVVLGQIGGDPARSYRNAVDSIYRKIDSNLFKTGEFSYMQTRLDIKGSTGYAKFNDGLFKED